MLLPLTHMVDLRETQIADLQPRMAMLFGPAISASISKFLELMQILQIFQTKEHT